MVDRASPPDVSYNTLRRRSLMNTALWIVAVLLTAVYLFSGFGKLLMPREKMATMMSASAWVLDFQPRTLKAIGAVEILGAVGLVLPAVLGIATVLVPWAAVGLAVVMVGAIALRIRRHEPAFALADLVYFALAAFVAIGRFGPAPFKG